MNPKTFEIIPLFSIPLFRDTVEVGHYNFDEIDWEINQFNLNSKNHKILDFEQFKELKYQIIEKTKFYFYRIMGADLKIQLKITDSWLNRSTESNRHQRHYHRDSIISGVVFLSAEESSGGNLVFHSEKRPWIDFNVSEDKQSIWNMTEWLERPKVGQLLIFPSYLDHEVEEYTSKNSRISLSWNTWIQS